MLKRYRNRRGERGQILVIVAVGLVGMIAIVGLVLDGGYAWGRQRETQNGTDAMALAAAGVIQENFAGVPRTDGHVGCALRDVAAANEVENPGGVYTDGYGNPIGIAVGPCGAVGPIPAGVQGVQATSDKSFDPFLMQVVGFGQLTTDADATAIVGLVDEVLTGPILPVTFPEDAEICDSTNASYEIGVAPWNYIDPSSATAANLATVPLCTTGPGSVGWIDVCEGNVNLQTMVNDPCSVTIQVPAWIHTQTGNVNNLEDDIREYTGDQPGVPELAPAFDGDPVDAIIKIPIHDNTCSGQPADGDPTCEPIDSEGSGNGDNLYYHVPYWVEFMLDQAHTGGGDTECRQSPGTPVIVPPAPGVSCLKGWFVDIVDAVPIVVGPIPPGNTRPIAVTLVQ